MADDGFTMFESGAMLQYVLDRYGDGRLVPEPGTADRRQCRYGTVVRSRPIRGRNSSCRTCRTW